MARTLGLISIVAALAVGGFLLTRSASEAVPPAGGSVVEDAALQTAADANLLAARTGVEAFSATAGTFAGAPVPTGVALVSADTAYYCVQVGSGPTARHLAGPGGGPLPGPCQAP